MKISDCRTTPIAFADPPLRAASGLHAPYALRIVFEMTSEAGVTGISEVPCNPGTLEGLRAVADRIRGKDAIRTKLLLREIDEALAEGGAERDARGAAPWDQGVRVHVASAIEVAALDLVGKTLDVRVCDLVGGACRESVPFGAYLFFKEEGAGGEFEFGLDPDAEGWAAARQREAKTPATLVDQARGMCEAFGFPSIKVKGGVLDPKVEAESMEALYEAFGPEVPLRLDPNAVWSVPTGLRIGRRLETILEYFEDPVRGQRAMAELGRQLRCPLATNMCTTSFSDLPASFGLHSEDVILCDHHFWGGIRPCLELARFCGSFGRGVSMHSNSHLGVSLAAMAHTGAAIPNLDYDLDTHYPWQRDEIIADGRIAFDGGRVAIPDGPGLGVTLDHDAVERLHQDYLDCGLTQRNDEREMQKIEPGWKFQATRW